jgi:hypothetical protein
MKAPGIRLLPTNRMGPPFGVLREPRIIGKVRRVVTEWVEGRAARAAGVFPLGFRR